MGRGDLIIEIHHILVYLYDAQDSPIGMGYRNSMYPSGVTNTYWFEKNLQGDVIAIYNEGGTKLVSYTYDAWGKPTESTPTYLNGGESTAVQYNPFRYRGYYYDSELGFYYLNSRYYDPETGRFIIADTFVNANGDMPGFNMFAYCSNNPVNRTDAAGFFWESVWDIVSIGFGVADVVSNPTDIWAWAGLAGDVIDLIPFVSCVGEVTRAANVGRKVLDTVDDLHDAGRTIDKIGDATEAFDGTIDTYKVLKKADFRIGKEVHHIIEKRFAKSIGINNTDEMLSIVLDKQTHRKFTNAWRNAFKYGTDYSLLGKEDIWNAAQSVYANCPELIEAARKTIFN